MRKTLTYDDAVRMRHYRQRILNPLMKKRNKVAIPARVIFLLYHFEDEHYEVHAG